VKDYYAALGVPPTATAAQIKAAYRKLAHKLHPDRNGGDPVAEALFKLVTEAYDVLGDEAKRRIYDSQYTPAADAARAADCNENDDRIELAGPGAPYEVAKQLYNNHLLGERLAHLLAWRGGWMTWHRTHWAEIDAAELRQAIYETLSHAAYLHPIRVKGVTVDYEKRDWDPDKHKVANVVEALAAVVQLSRDVDPPSWLLTSADARTIAAPGDITETPATQVISCRNGLLDLSTHTLHPHARSLFNLVSVPFDYDPDADEPVEWLDFLTSVWGADADSVALLREYMGYILSGRLDMQKALRLIGPIRSGKGTIERVLAALMGGNIASPTLAGLNTNFGLSPLIGRPLAFVTDARLGNTPSHVVVERLLSITGEDWLTIDRKYREPWTGKLPTRFVILSNELPKFRDSSGAIASRLLILQMTKSFLGREDHQLDAKLYEELGQILSWALEGLSRLTDKGVFTEPQSSRDAVALMADLASPASAFVRERCVRDAPQAWVPRAELYAAWRTWAIDNGHHPGANSTFGRDLRAVVPELGSAQRRIGDQVVWCYTHIGLKPVTPVTEDEDAGQESAAVTGCPVTEAATDQAAFGDIDPDTGAPVTAEDSKSHVSGHVTGVTGRTPNVNPTSSGFTPPAGPGRCVQCGWHVPTQGHVRECSANLRSRIPDE
jgi:putative DNA primase/helicase